MNLGKADSELVTLERMNCHCHYAQIRASVVETNCRLSSDSR